MLSIAVNAWLNIVAKRGGYKARSILGLLAVGCAVFIVVMLKPAPVYISAVKRRVRKYYSKLVG
jgi:hypothetical protein